MILLDTHLWIWWVQADQRLPQNEIRALDGHASSGIGVSVISIWEVAMLQIRRRLILPCPLDDWLDSALSYPGVRIVEMSRVIAVESCRLPEMAHKDPADRILIATAREFLCPLITADIRIRDYPHVESMTPAEFCDHKP